jgi:hypothetical protein
MSDDEDYQRRWRQTRDAGRPPPYPGSAVGNDDRPPLSAYEPKQFMPSNAYPPPPPGGPPANGQVPPPPLGDNQMNRRPSAMKRSGSQSRVAHLAPQFPDEVSQWKHY